LIKPGQVPVGLSFQIGSFTYAFCADWRSSQASFAVILVTSIILIKAYRLAQQLYYRNFRENKTFSIFNLSYLHHGVILMGLGLYFVFIRPPLPPEDPRFMGTTAEIQVTVPGLLIWLRRLLGNGRIHVYRWSVTTYVAATAFQQLARSVRFVIALAALTSIGWMAVINFMINSDFKWLLLAFNLPWIAALVLSWRENRLIQA
jgi:hypothetical protein